jgi:hypothetical protein
LWNVRSCQRAEEAEAHEVDITSDYRKLGTCRVQKKLGFETRPRLELDVIG